MKTIYKITFALCLLATTAITQAQSVIVPAANPSGTGLTQTPWRKPLGTNRAYERTAIKYTQAEIGTLGNITDLGFYVDTINNPGYTIAKIYLKEITDSTFAAGTTVAAEETGATLVFNDTIFPASFVKGQWTMVTLTTPFIHATTNNIEVIVETNSGGTAGTDVATLAKGFRYSAITGTAREEYWQSPTGNGTPPAGNATLLNGNRHNIQFVFTPLVACVAPPTAGTANANPALVCPGNSTTITLTGTTSGTGLTYQWLSSSDNLTWSAISGETNASYTGVVSANTYYTCVVTCSAQSDTATSVYVTLNTFNNCYCSANLGGNCATSAIDTVSIVGTTLANGPTGCAPGFYTAYPGSGSTTATLTQGQTYQLDTRYNGNVKSSVWIDYDHNGVFDTYEWSQVCLTSVAGTIVSANINIPLTAQTGVTGMRIRSRNSTGANDSTSACTTFGSGETEDYLIDIVAAPPCVAPPSAGTASSNPDTVCSGTVSNITLAGYTSGTGTTFQWVASTDGGATWNNVPGAISPILNVTPTATTLYACVVTCSAQSDTSVSASVTVNPFYNCYCTNIGGNCTTTPASTIDSVAIETTTLANGLTGCAPTFYTAYPANGNTTTTLTAGQTYNIDVTLQGSAKAEMWIDYDQSGTFDPLEGVQVCLTATAGVPNVVAFTVPSGALPGLTGMRVRSRSTAGALDSTSACLVTGSGETEDYLVTISSTVGIKSNLQKNQLYIFPNPSNGMISVALTLNNPSKVSMTVVNVNGETVYSEQAGMVSGIYNRTVDLSAMSKGIYFVKVISDKEVITKKIILQ